MKRRLLILGLLLIAGAIINVVVAWAVVLIERTIERESQRASAELSDDIVTEVVRIESPVTTVIVASRVSGSWEVEAHARYFQGDPLQLAPCWAAIDSPSSQFTYAMRKNKTERVFEYQLLVATGWPARTLWMEGEHFVKYGASGIMVHQSPVRASIGGSSLTTINVNRDFPTRLITTGFVINTLFYAVVLWLLVILNPILRQRQRAKRGLCPACAYPVGSSEVCTECGKRVPRSGFLKTRMPSNAI